MYMMKYAGVIKVLGVIAASQQLFSCYRVVTQMLGVIKVLGVNAASQQTLFIVSGSPSIQC